LIAWNNGVLRVFDGARHEKWTWTSLFDPSIMPGRIQLLADGNGSHRSLLVQFGSQFFELTSADGQLLRHGGGLPREIRNRPYTANHFWLPAKSPGAPPVIVSHGRSLVALDVLTVDDRQPDPVVPLEARPLQPLERQAQGRISPVSETRTPTSARSDHEKIQGDWTFVTLTTEHRDQIVFSGDKFSWHIGEQTLDGTFVIDATTQPKRIDLTFQGERDVAGIRLGIYDFRKDLLAICLHAPGEIRPAKLEATEGQTILFFQPANKEP
jgi:uncharacterized protein (TIGR03067 family)